MTLSRPPENQMIPQCRDCGDRKLAFCPIPLSDFVLENLRDRLKPRDLTFYCSNCGRKEPYASLLWIRI